MDEKRFCAYMTGSETTQLEMARVELSLPPTGLQLKRNSDLLLLMRLSLQHVMDGIRRRKRLELENAGDGAEISVIVTWRDVCKEIGVSETVMSKLMERDLVPKRSPKNASSGSTQAALPDSSPSAESQPGD